MSKHDQQLQSILAKCRGSKQIAHNTGVADTAMTGELFRLRSRYTTKELVVLHQALVQHLVQQRAFGEDPLEEANARYPEIFNS